MRRHLYLLAVLLIGFCAVNFRSQNLEEKIDQPKDHLIIKAKVEQIQKDLLSPDAIPSHNSYLVVTYKVLEVCKGEYFDELIKVAHRGGSERGLNIGDEMYWQLERTTRYREFARSVLEVFGSLVPEESLADFDIVEEKQSCP